MRMIDQGEADDKIIAVAANDMSVNHIDNINELPIHTINQVQRFFEDYKKLEHKDVVVENFLPKEDAFRIIRESIQTYKDKFLW
jgi:inorganic pyrophosphatase